MEPTDSGFFVLTCRTCLNVTEELSCIFKCEAVNSEKRLVLLRELMLSCSIQISESDSLPKRICSNCQSKLDTTLSFLEQCKQADKFLRSQSSFKVENESHLLTIKNLNNNDISVPTPEIIADKEPEIEDEDDDDDNEGYIDNCSPDSEVVIKAEPVNSVLPCDSDDDLPLSLLSSVIKKETENSGSEENVPSSKIERKHPCRECNKSFKSVMSLLNHRKKHTGTLSHVCEVCKENFPSFQQIKKHMLTQHSGMKYRPFVCNICNNTFQSHYHLMRHEQVKHSKKLFPCTECKKAFSSFSSLKYHQNVHLGVRPYSCTECFKSFTQASVLREHMINIHALEKKFTCHCGKSFSRKRKLEIHIDSVHEKKDTYRKHACDKCDKKFLHPYSLRNHMNTHLGIKPYLCSVCAAAFTAQNNLHTHFIRAHSSEKKVQPKIYLCSDCGNSFSRTAHLKRHILRKHTENAEKKFECPICQKKFLENSCLKTHMKLHEDFKPCECTQCCKSFRTNWRLQAHINRVHLGLRPFQCNTCSVRFKTKSHLEKHIRTHTGEKPYPCPHCSYMCAEKSNLKKHINVHLKAR